MVQDVWILKTGELNLDRSILLMGQGYGCQEIGPTYSVLLKTADGFILVDTGMNPDGATDPAGTWGERAKLLVPNVRAEDDIRKRLQVIGVKPEEIKFVINTHLHWDHTGGNRFFTRAVFIVQNAEYRYAFHTDKTFGSSYMRNHFDHPLNYRMVEGDEDVCEGVRVIFTPGHTPGHQSVLAHFENGKYLIICGDAVYTHQNFENLVPPGNSYDYQMSVLSLHKLRTIQNLTDAVYLPSHEPSETFFFDVETQLKTLTTGK